MASRDGHEFAKVVCGRLLLWGNIHRAQAQPVQGSTTGYMALRADQVQILATGFPPHT